MKQHVYKPGDRVRILRPRLIMRVGYPLHYKELRAEAAELLQVISQNNGMSQLGFRHSSYTRNPPKDLVEGLTKALVLDRGYGGPERSIHYYPIGRPVPEGDLWTMAIASDWTEDYQLQPRMDPTGKIALVEAKYTRKTGTRVAGGSSTDWESGHQEWENGYLENEKTHVILRTTYGDIEACDVELVEPA